MVYWYRHSANMKLTGRRRPTLVPRGFPLNSSRLDNIDEFSDTRHTRLSQLFLSMLIVIMFLSQCPYL